MIVLPHENTFGYLVIASVSTILVGALFYIIYATRNWNGTALQKCDEVQSLTSSTTSDSDGYGGTDDHSVATPPLQIELHCGCNLDAASTQSY